MKEPGYYLRRAQSVYAAKRNSCGLSTIEIVLPVIGIFVTFINLTPILPSNPCQPHVHPIFVNMSERGEPRPQFVWELPNSFLQY